MHALHVHGCCGVRPHGLHAQMQALPAPCRQCLLWLHTALPQAPQPGAAVPAVTALAVTAGRMHMPAAAAGQWAVAGAAPSCCCDMHQPQDQARIAEAAVAVHFVRCAVQKGWVLPARWIAEVQEVAERTAAAAVHHPFVLPASCCTLLLPVAMPTPSRYQRCWWVRTWCLHLAGCCYSCQQQQAGQAHSWLGAQGARRLVQIHTPHMPHQFAAAAAAAVVAVDAGTAGCLIGTAAAAVVAAAAALQHMRHVMYRLVPMTLQCDFQ